MQKLIVCLILVLALVGCECGKPTKFRFQPGQTCYVLDTKVIITDTYSKGYEVYYAIDERKYIPEALVSHCDPLERSRDAREPHSSER